MFEEGIGEFLDLAGVHLSVFTTEIFLHDPVVAHYDVPLGIKCCNNVSRLDGLFCQCCSLFGESDVVVLVFEECQDQQCISSCWHVCQCCSDASSSRITLSMHAMWMCILPEGFDWDLPDFSPCSMMLIKCSPYVAWNMNVMGFFANGLIFLSSSMDCGAGLRILYFA